MRINHSHTVLILRTLLTLWLRMIYWIYEALTICEAFFYAVYMYQYFQFL